MMIRYNERIIISESEIKKRVGELVEQVARDFTDEDLVVVGILKGSFIFLADLTRLMYLHDMNPQIDFMILSSYGAGTTPSMMIKIERDLSVMIEGKAVLVVDDILDTGKTMFYVKERLKWLEPRMVKTCVFLDKPARRKVQVTPDYVGFTVEDKFVVGYGLDYDGYFRERPYIAVIDELS